MKVHTYVWSFRKYPAFCGFVGLKSHHAPPPLPRGYTNSLLWMNTYVENYCLIIKENLGNKI